MLAYFYDPYMYRAQQIKNMGLENIREPKQKKLIGKQSKPLTLKMAKNNCQIWIGATKPL
jgi:hypothetical protein